MSYRKKNRILCIAAVLAIPLVYKLAISETISYKNQYEKLRVEKEQAASITSRMLSLKKQSMQLDSVLEKENISITNSFQQIVLKRINTFKEKTAIEVVTFDNPVMVKDNGVQIMLYSMTVRGDFNALLQFLNYVEQEGLAEIKNFKFEKKKNYRTRKEYLVLEIYLKKIVEKV